MNIPKFSIPTFGNVVSAAQELISPPAPAGSPTDMPAALASSPSSTSTSSGSGMIAIIVAGVLAVAGAVYFFAKRGKKKSRRF